MNLRPPILLLAASAALASAGEWSIKATLAPEKSVIMVGEPTFLTYSLENTGDSDAWVIEGGDYRNELGRPERFKVSAVDEHGAAARSPKVGVTMGGFVTSVKIPAHGKYTAELFLPAWAIFEKPGLYILSAKRTLNLSRKSSNFDERNTAAVPTGVSCELLVVSTNHERMGALIDHLAASMLGPNSDASERSTTMLTAIRDERTIPCLVKAAESSNYSLRFQALRALAHYNSDTALAALEKGLSARSGDMASAPVDDTLAENIRACAANSLRDSAHPGAHAVLLAHRHDPTFAVRLTAVHLLGATNTEEASAMLREMSDDSNERVRNEARRYLRERQK